LSSHNPCCFVRPIYFDDYSNLTDQCILSKERYYSYEYTSILTSYEIMD